ncbi:hypothetical protein ZIOFF_019512 [Zingiber officinale]|uniref:Uncharacterized protein n=1 Tax=Zingiber officinale TaxID=94328 RepID=A0A8J5LBR1_ZINOF|nr:hypothetical protein ZIOFF_019512 [Zingiber officinale]
MSKQWEEAIQEWYTKSHTSNLEHLNLTETKPTTKELAHNLSVIYDKVCLSSRVHIKHFKTLLEELEVVKLQNQKLEEVVKILVAENRKAERVFSDLKEKLAKIDNLLQKLEHSILARSYENWQHGEANLLITRGLVGRLSNTPNVGFAYEVENVVDYQSRSSSPSRTKIQHQGCVLGQNWIIRQSVINILMQPTEVNTRNLLDGSVSLHFESYQAASASTPPRYNSRDEEVQSDEDELRTHVVAVLIKEAPLLVKKVYPDALLPERKTIGTAGYDLSVYKSQMIPAKGMAILHTSICLQLPQEVIHRHYFNAPRDPLKRIFEVTHMSALSNILYRHGQAAIDSDDEVEDVPPPELARMTLGDQMTHLEETVRREIQGIR